VYYYNIHLLIEIRRNNEVCAILKMQATVKIYEEYILLLQKLFGKKATVRKLHDRRRMHYSTCYLVYNVPKAAGRTQVKRCPSHGYNLS
jgi:hypothetical protein